MLFSALTLSAQSNVDWSTYEYLGDGAGGGKYTNKYKVSAADGLSVVNIQKPGFAEEVGIYVTVPAGISACSVNGKIDGAGVVLYLSSFTAKETQVTINYAGGSCTFWVYYADGTTGETPDPGTGEGGEEPEPTPDPEPEPGAIDWSAIAWIGNGSGDAVNTDKYKVSPADGLSVVNIQKPGFAEEVGIYVSVPAGISACSVNGKIDGAGVVLYLSSFTAKETQVTINYAGGSCTFWVYYADGITGETPDPGTGEGGEEPEPNPDPTVTPGYTANTTADYSYLYTNDAAGNVYLWLTFKEAIAGVAGPLFFTENNAQVSATTTDNKVFFASVSGKKDGDKVQLRAYIPRAGGLTQTPLLSHTVGTESGLIVTEYCNYTNNQLTKNGASITLSWETVDNGDVVITMGNGVGTTSCSYRNGGFEGGIEAFVVSTDNFATTTPASDYFTFEKVYSGNEARLVNIANLPKGAKIKHAGGGPALAWVVNGTNEYDRPEFIYTYGGVCNNLDAPTNVAVTDAGVVTFDEVLDATSYEVRVYQGVTLKYTQEITNGGTINFEAYVAGEYTVKVVAKAIDKDDSLESDGVTWNVAASPLPISNYCEAPADRITENQGSCNPLFSWITDATGNVVITISASEGDENATMFRNNAMGGDFLLDGSKDNFIAYFNRVKTDDYTYTLTLKDAANKPLPGAVISYSGQIEAKSSIHVDDWSKYVFDAYLYGTTCEETTEPDGPTTNVENTLNSVQIQKTIRNGALYIIYNGVTYDVMGCVVR